MADRPLPYDTNGAVAKVFDTAGNLVFGSTPAPHPGFIFPTDPADTLPAGGTETAFTTYDGSDATCHPSVVDMVAETGSPWNGHRWWCADTPYVDPSYIPPGAPEGAVGSWIENPCIWHTDDRIDWTVPTGVNNPLDGPPSTGYFSDTELVYDPDGGRLVLYYRHSTGYLLAKTSTDGSTWVSTGKRHDPQAAGNVSPTIVRMGAGDWRMWTFGDTTPPVMYSATDPTGPWSLVGQVTMPNMPKSLWHGDIIRHGDVLIGVASDRSSNNGIPFLSRDDGMTWTAGAAVPTLGGYRTTLAPSTKSGYVESWNGRLGFNRPTWNATPESAWLNLA